MKQECGGKKTIEDTLLEKHGKPHAKRYGKSHGGKR